MKKLLLLLLILLSPGGVALAQLSTHAGGIGLVDVSAGSIPFGSVFNLRLATSSGFQWTNTTSNLLFTYGSSTAISATTICFIGDTCRTTWPAAGGAFDPFTHPTNFGTTTAATTSPIWLTSGIFASTTKGGPASQFDNSTTTLASIFTLFLPNLTSGGLGVDSSGQVYKAASTTFSAPFVYTPATNAVTCTSASSGVTGCLTGTDWSTFNSKLGADPYWVFLNSAVSTTSSLLVNNASSTITNLVTINSTSTNATTTSFQVGALASTTNLRVSSLGSAGTKCVQSDVSGLLSITSSGCNTGTVTSLTAGTGLNGGVITTSGTISLKSYIGTSTADTATQIAVFTSTNAVPATLGGFSGYTINAAGTLATFTNASTTQLTVATGLQIPNSSNPASLQTGYVAQSTNTPFQLRAGSAVFDPRIPLTLGISTTTAWTGTSTPTALPVIPIPVAITWNSISCTIQPAGATLEAEYRYANSSAYTTVSTFLLASSTPGVIVLSSNNVPTANATSTIVFGNPTGSPTSASCTLMGTITGI